MSQERRTAARVLITTAVRVETARGILRFQCLNLSTGGIYLESEKPLAVGTEIKLKFDLPGQGPVEAQGVVKHHNPLVIEEPGTGEQILHGMGIAFLRIEGVGSQALAEQVKQLTLRGR